MAVYAVFVADYLVRLYLAEPRGRWFVRHLFDLAIVVLPFLRPLRLLSLVVVINLLQRALGHTIRGKVVAYTVCGAVLIVYAASLAIIDMERDHPDANIKAFGDALWWSITTVTTGYNDLAPLTTEGRMVAVALMIGGISLVGHRHCDTGFLDRATRRRGGHRQSGRDRRADRAASPGNQTAREVGGRERQRPGRTSGR